MKAVGKRHGAFYKFLEPFLENGNEDTIKRAKAEWKRKYKAEWRRLNRKKNKEITVPWSQDELKILKAEAKRHKLSNTRFIKEAVIAYIDNRYIVPDQIEVRRIAQLLSVTYNAIREMMDENAMQLQTGKIILEKIFDLERQVLVSLHNPKTIEQLIAETVNNNPQTKIKLYHLLETLQ